MNFSTEMLGWLTLSVYLIGYVVFIITTRYEMVKLIESDIGAEAGQRYERELRADLRWSLLWPIRTLYIITRH